MQEVAQRRLEVRREQVGLDLQGLRNVNATPATVEEAVERLVEVERSGRRYRNMMAEKAEKAKRAKEAGTSSDLHENSDVGNGEVNAPGDNSNDPPQTSRAERLARNAQDAATRKLFKEGRLVHRTEPEIRTHTSYLIFAILPIEWTAEDEERCMKQWPVGNTGPQKQK